MGKQGWFVPSNGREWCSRVTFKRCRQCPHEFLAESIAPGPARTADRVRIKSAPTVWSGVRRTIAVSGVQRSITSSWQGIASCRLHAPMGDRYGAHEVRLLAFQRTSLGGPGDPEQARSSFPRRLAGAALAVLLVVTTT